MKSNGPIAHVAEDGRVHGLEEHLRGTAELAWGLRGDQWQMMLNTRNLLEDVGRYSWHLGAFSA